MTPENLAKKVGDYNGTAKRHTVQNVPKTGLAKKSENELTIFRNNKIFRNNINNNPTIQRPQILQPQINDVAQRRLLRVLQPPEAPSHLRSRCAVGGEGEAPSVAVDPASQGALGRDRCRRRESSKKPPKNPLFSVRLSRFARR